LKYLSQRTTLVFDLTDSVTIGCESMTDSNTPHISLESYNALELGVSRCHAILKLEDGRVFIVDNYSVKGVALNHETLSPGVAYPVRHNDTIRMGLMSFQIHFLAQPFGR
jgi:pSer/pThr/pTyr-binding forkhead associated (FHA) protein